MFIEHATNIFCKGSENKYFRLYKTVSVAAPQLCRGTMKVPEDNTQANGRGCVPIKLYLQNRHKAGFVPWDYSLLTLDQMICRVLLSLIFQKSRS